MPGSRLRSARLVKIDYRFARFMQKFFFSLGLVGARLTLISEIGKGFQSQPKNEKLFLIISAYAKAKIFAPAADISPRQSIRVRQYE